MNIYLGSESVGSDCTPEKLKKRPSRWNEKLFKSSPFCHVSWNKFTNNNSKPYSQTF